MQSRFAFLAVWFCAVATAQFQRTVPPPRVNPDLSVTYFLDVDAKSVILADSVFAVGPPGLPAIKGPDGIWSVTTPPYPPGTHEYGWVIDGVLTGALSANSAIDRLPQGWYPFDLIDVRGPEPLLNDVQPVAHGMVHIHTFTSPLFGREVSLYVYTPPGYDSSKQNYPALYLLHGSIERESTWTRFGYADRIMDNLVASGEAKEMIVVMPDTGTPDATDQPLDLVVQYMLAEIIPLAEQKYRVDARQQSRYVAGVAAGSNRARELAFLHPEMFAAVGIWAGGGLGNGAAPLDVSYPKIKDAAAFNALVKYIYLALGEEDNHTAGVKNNVQRLKDSLDQLGISSTFYLATGGHTWFNFRRFLAIFLKGLP